MAAADAVAKQIKDAGSAEPGRKIAGRAWRDGMGAEQMPWRSSRCRCPMPLATSVQFLFPSSSGRRTWMAAGSAVAKQVKDAGRSTRGVHSVHDPTAID
jgi:hypothetical protein